MPTQLRRLGVHGKNAPVRKTLSVTPANFTIAGLIGIFERQFLNAFQCDTPQQVTDIFGGQIGAGSSAYGYDAVNLFWNNIGGANASLIIKSHVGYNGSSVNATQAAATATDCNGLASICTILNEMRTKINAHAADATEHTTHVDNVNFPITTPYAQDLYSAMNLCNQLIISYSAHEADAALASVWAYHKGQETGTHALTSQIATYDIATLVTMLTDFKTKYNAHDADTSAHGGAGSTHQLSSSAPSSTRVSTVGLGAGYLQINTEYGTSGNRTGYTIEHGIRFTTTLSSAFVSGGTVLTLASVAGLYVGDYITIYFSGGTAGTQYATITAIDETLLTVTVKTAITATGNVGDTVDVPAFRIHTWRKSTTGIITEQQTDLGATWLTMAPTVSSCYAPTIHAQNKWLIVTDNSDSAANVPENFPNATSLTTPILLTGGTAGTTPSTSAHWALDLLAFNNQPIVMLTNTESTDVATNKAGESYCWNRDDSPIWIYNLAENQTLAQYETLGNGYQRSNEVDGVAVANWLGVNDPFNNSVNAPDRIVPNVGAVMGAWCQTIALLGIHYIPAVDSIVLNGINSIYNVALGNLSDTDRTTLASYGINIIQYVNGSGFRIRNFFTPSTNVAYQFANGVIMRNFIKVSSQNSLLSSENTPNSFNRIQEDGSAINTFLYQLWDKGSTGSVPTGETFGQQQNPDGTLTQPSDHFQVEADAINNPLSQIEAGQRTITVYFTYPTPAGSIEIDVGILLR